MGDLKAHIYKLTDILQEGKLQNNMKDDEISPLIFSTVKLRFLSASSTPWLPEVLVVTKILIPEPQKDRTQDW